MKTDWTVNDIPDLSGKIAIVTGSNIGLGLEIARQLAAHKAKTILACRNMDKADAAKAALQSELGESEIETMELDTSSLASVKAFASAFKERYERIDILMCNAGVMALQERKESVDGFELQFATNHLGHFVLVGELLPLCRAAPACRIVTQSSSANWGGKFRWDDLQATSKYERWPQYCMTKLSNITFVNELNRRLQSGGTQNVTAYAAHPGYVIGQLQYVSAGGRWLDTMIYKLTGLLSGTYASGALPALFACTSAEARVGEFYGPDGFYGGISKGKHPRAVEENKLAHDPECMKRLFDTSEELTGFKYSFET